MARDGDGEDIEACHPVSPGEPLVGSFPDQRHVAATQHAPLLVQDLARGHVQVLLRSQRIHHKTRPQRQRRQLRPQRRIRRQPRRPLRHEMEQRQVRPRVPVLQLRHGVQRVHPRSHADAGREHAPGGARETVRGPVQRHCLWWEHLCCLHLAASLGGEPVQAGLQGTNGDGGTDGAEIEHTAQRRMYPFHLLLPLLGRH
mmetsp:Transcript_40634/g.97381  ORF Transcript_40634/g.97381 Transcript_40634/m.97381 type:complete len:200 (+) Transcript_40634:603-1202(+)